MVRQPSVDLRARPEQRHDLLGEPRELFDLVDDRPDEHPLNAGVLECGQLLGERFGGADGQAFSQDLLRTVNGRQEALTPHTLPFLGVVCEVEPHGGQPVAEADADVVRPRSR